MIEDQRAPIDPESLKDPSKVIVQFIMYVYNMDSFVYTLMNLANRTLDTSKADTLGPFAKIFGQIIANLAHNNIQVPFSSENTIDLYRGVILTQI